MAVIFEDHMSGEASDVVLTSHTPDTTGTSWGSNIGTSSREFEVQSATDDVGLTGASANDNIVQASSPNPTSAEYDIEWTFNSAPSSGDDAMGACARLADINNYYWFKIDAGFGGSGAVLGIMASGSPTVLDSDGTVDYTDNGAYKFEIRDAAKKVYKNSSEILSSTNNDITAAGSACFATGNYGDDSGDDPEASIRWDDYVVTEVSGISDLSINVNDSVTVAESVALRFDPLLISVNDSVTLADSPTVRMSLYIPTITDSVSVADSPVMNVIVMPSVSDGVSVSDSPTMFMNLNVNVADTVTVGDSPTVVRTGAIEINVTESVIVVDSPLVIFNDPQISVADGVAVADAVIMNVKLMPSVSDAVTLADSPAVHVKLMPNVFDGVSVGETVTMHLLVFISVNDSVTVADSPSVSIVTVSAISINVNESVTVAESVSLTGPTAGGGESFVGERWKGSVGRRKKESR